MPTPISLFAQTAEIAQAATASNEMTMSEAVILSLVGIVAVFVVLSLIAVAIGMLPKLLDAFDPWLPKLHGELHAASPPGLGEALPAREERIVAAIGYVLHQEMLKARK